MRHNLTHAVEDYLKTIYTLTQGDARASTNDLAAALQITPASVSGMLRKLAANDPPLIEYEKHRGVILTDAGKRVALEIIRHHRLLELFLTQTLGYPWDRVHQEADRLEHVISEEFEQRIAEILGHPRHDPHGDPIPSMDLTLPPDASLPLTVLRPGESASIQRVSDRDPEMLNYLEKIGLVPNAAIRILAFSPFDENLTIRVEGQSEPITLGPRVTQHIFVNKTNKAKNP